MKTVKILTSVEHIEEASALLHTVYIEHNQWNFSPDNPSKIRIEVKNNRKLLLDKFTEMSTWFGVFKDDKLIGCLRIQGTDNNNLFAIEEYENSHVVRPFISSQKKQCVELAKFCFPS